MRKIIGITGRANSGKDTFAQGLLTAGYRRGAFADMVKVVTATLAGEPVGYYHDIDLKDAYCDTLGTTRRVAMQRVGNGMRGIMGDNVWINALLRDWIAKGSYPMVITDIRYNNEAQAIIGAGGVIVHIERPDAKELEGEASTHISEQGIAENLIQHRVVNDGDIRQLINKATLLLDVLDGGRD